MRNTWRILAALAALLSAPAALAQSARPVTPPTPEPELPRAPEPGLRFISSEMSFSGKVVKSKPFSARTVSESTHTLSNGAKLTRRTTGMIYRDGEGRTRREQSATTAGPFATSGDSQRLIFINDPVAGASSTIMPDSDTVLTRTFPAANPDAPPDATFPPENSLAESLGRRMIEGFEAEGTRTTILIPAGRVGNDQPLEIVHERWYSPELQTILLSKHSDPRWGETVYQLTNIDRSAPDRSLFNLPTAPPPPRNKSRPRR